MREPALHTWTVVLLAGLLAVAPVFAAPQHPLGVPEKAYITRTLLGANVTGGAEKETVALVEYLTGEKAPDRAIGLLLGVYTAGGKGARPLWVRDCAEGAEGGVSRGELSLLDLDGDGRSEIIVTMHGAEQPATTRVVGEIFRARGDSFDLVWSGLVRLDTTSPEVGLPPAERESYSREINVARSLRSAGGLVAFDKRVLVVAGIPLNPPRVVEESFPLEGPQER